MLRCLNLLVEGNSIRITGVYRDTILHLLNVLGERCQELMDETIVNIPLERIEADEIWGFVQKKEGHKYTALDVGIANNLTADATPLPHYLTVCYHSHAPKITTMVSEAVHSSFPAIP